MTLPRHVCSKIHPKHKRLLHLCNYEDKAGSKHYRWNKISCSCCFCCCSCCCRSISCVSSCRSCSCRSCSCCTVGFFCGTSCGISRRRW